MNTIPLILEAKKGNQLAHFQPGDSASCLAFLLSFLKGKEGFFCLCRLWLFGIPGLGGRVSLNMPILDTSPAPAGLATCENRLSLDILVCNSVWQVCNSGQKLGGRIKKLRLGFVCVVLETLRARGRTQVVVSVLIRRRGVLPR